MVHSHTRTRWEGRGGCSAPPTRLRRGAALASPPRFGLLPMGGMACDLASRRAGGSRRSHGRSSGSLAACLRGVGGMCQAPSPRPTGLLTAPWPLATPGLTKPMPTRLPPLAMLCMCSWLRRGRCLSNGVLARASGRWRRAKRYRRRRRRAVALRRAATFGRLGMPLTGLGAHWPRSEQRARRAGAVLGAGVASAAPEHADDALLRGGAHRTPRARSQVPCQDNSRAACTAAYEARWPRGALPGAHGPSRCCSASRSSSRHARLRRNWRGCQQTPGR